MQRVDVEITRSDKAVIALHPQHGDDMVVWCKSVTDPFCGYLKQFLHGSVVTSRALAIVAAATHRYDFIATGFSYRHYKENKRGVSGNNLAERG